jgi:anti-sigma B factor antagonist
MIGTDDRFRWEGERAVVTMPAEIDLTNADEVRHTLRAAASHGATVLIIDMSATTFCDSAGVQAIIDVHNLIDARNQTAATRTRLLLVASAVGRIITLTGIDQLMPVYSSLEAALASPPA